MDPLAGRLVKQLQDDPEAPEIVGLEGEDADVIFDALSSETTRAVLSKCYDGGRTRSELADELDTTLQNVSYHVEKLEGAGLIEPAEIRYGENRQEVRVYEPSKEAILIAAGETGLIDRIKHAVERLFSPIIALGLAAMTIAAIARNPDGFWSVDGFGLGADDDGTTGDAYTFDDGDRGTTDADEAADDVDDGPADDDPETATADEVEEDAPPEDDEAAPDDGDAADTLDGAEFDTTADAATESTDLLVQEPWFLAGAGVFLLGLVVVVTADRFGVFDPRPRSQRTGQRALLLGQDSHFTRKGIGGAVVFGLVTLLTLYAAVAGFGGVLGALAGIAPMIAILASVTAGVYHAARNDGVFVTIGLVLAPLLAVWAFLLGVPGLADGAYWFVTATGLLATLIGTLLGLATYAAGIAVKQLWSAVAARR